MTTFAINTRAEHGGIWRLQLSGEADLANAVQITDTVAEVLAAETRQRCSWTWPTSPSWTPVDCAPC